MRKLLLIATAAFAFSLSFSTLHAQKPPKFDHIKLEVKEDFTPEVDQTVLAVANYLLTTPADNDNPSRRKAMAFLIDWMNKSPTYTFIIDETANKISDKNRDMFGIYLVAMTKFCIENTAESKKQEIVKMNALKLVLEYCKFFNLKMAGELKKINNANEKGELNKYLKM